MKPPHSIRPVFDDPDLVSATGLVPVLRLAEFAGLYDGLEGLTVPSPNAGAKTASVVGRMLAGLATQEPGLLVGGQADGIAFIDVDETVREVHGYAKQAAGFGYTGFRRLNVQLATISTPTAAPVIARARLRKGNAASHTRAARLLAQAMTTARAAGVTSRVLARADSAYYGHAFVGTAIRHGARFRVTARMNPQVKKAIASIDADAWRGIEYPNAIFDEAEQRWISDAEGADIDFVAFTSRRKRDHVPCRLIVRRVKRLQPLACDGSEQGGITTGEMRPVRLCA